MEKIDVDFGYIIPLDETDEVTAAILEIALKKKVAKHYHLKTREIEVILQGTVLVDGLEKSEGEILVWEIGQHHEYENPGSQTVQVLCIAIRKYDPADSCEIQR